MISPVHISTKTLLISLLGLLIAIWLGIYIGSAYWTAYQLKRDLLLADTTAIEKQVPKALLEKYKAKKLQHKASGTGAKYLRQVWPHVIKQQDLYQLLILEADATRGQDNTWQFTDFPSRFRLTLGEGHKQIWLQWQRQSWHTWQVSDLCIYNPQPLAEAKSCESSSR